MSARNPNAPAGQKPRRLTPEEGEQIIRLRLQGYTIRQVAEAIPTDPSTVQTRWKKWQAETTEERRADLEGERSTVIGVQRLIVSDALKAADDAETVGERVRCWQTATRAASELSRIAGFDAPKQVQLTAAVTMTEAEAAAILAEANQ